MSLYWRKNICLNVNEHSIETFPECTVQSLHLEKFENVALILYCRSDRTAEGEVAIVCLMFSNIIIIFFVETL